MKILTVDREKIIANLACIREEAGTEQVIAVLKANAYGLDMRQMAAVLSEHNVRRFGVIDPVDALRLRDWGFGEEEILVLRSTAVDEDITAILEACATATIGSYDAAVALNGMAEEQGQTCDIHIKIDTGMGRYGFGPGELERVLSVYRYMKNLHVTGMFTHYANAFTSRRKTEAQYESFMAMVDKVRGAGHSTGLLHASNSAALFHCKVPSLDAVRVGSSLGGRMTVRGDHGLHKVGRLESTVAEIRWLPTGHPVGYGSAFVTKKPTKIGIIPVGSSDGFMVEKARDSFRFSEVFRYGGSAFLSFLRRKRFYVTVKGKRARVLGHVGLSHTTVDLTDIDCAPGALAVFEVSPTFVPQSIERRYV